ncbi:MAG: DNA polymerase II [Candidatus Latescibacterota bacterium]|nr:DNA polymerase II [Candidatus Latescibacterota bacterium]
MNVSEVGPAQETVRGFLLHVFHRNRGAKTILYGVGRLETGETFALAESRRQPTFFVRSSEADDVRAVSLRSGADLTPSQLTTMDGEPVERVAVPHLPQLRRVAERIHEAGLRTYEADVTFTRQYLIDHDVRGSLTITGAWRPGSGVDRVYLDPEIGPGNWEPELSVLSIDIETLPDASEVIAFSLVGGGAGDVRQVEEVHVVGTSDPGDPEYLSCHPSEHHLIEALVTRIRALDPDVLTGWNLIDFDLTVLQQRCAEHSIGFNLGRSSDDSWYQEGDVWGGSRVVVYGRQVLDALHLIRATLQRFDDYRLDTVARAILGRGKTVEAEPGEAMPDTLMQTYQTDRRAFCDYCLEDSRLVRDLLEKENLIPLSLRRGSLTGLSLERAWGSVAAFDFLYISQLHKRGMVAPTSGIDREQLGGSPGGLVMPTRAGLYRHVFVFDFKSLYPSIIRTFNIDPLSRLKAKALFPQRAQPGEPGMDGELIRAPNGARFHREPGILPQLLERFFVERAQARAEGDELAAFAYKIVMNSFYGVLATDSCRFAEEELASAITEFGHYLLRWTRDRLQDEGRGSVLYGDTDSLFIDAQLPNDTTASVAWEHGSQLHRWLNDMLAKHVAERFNLPCHLELELEKCYRFFFLPPMRGGTDQARAKGYAGLKVDAEGKEEVEIIGMEAVRRDWTDLAHYIQHDLLERVFQEVPGVELENRVLDWVDAVRSGEKDEDLVYRKALRKSVESYTSTVPPHVAAARLMDKPHGVIRYVITRDGPQPVERLTAPPDYDHYIEKQIRPIVQTIGQVCDFDVEIALGGTLDLFRSRGN